MAVTRIVDSTRFLLLGAVTDWLAVSRRHPGSGIATTGGNLPPARSSKEIAAGRKLQRDRIVQLRWLASGELGYPSEPFKVWRRPAIPMEVEKSLTFTQTSLFLQRLVILQQPQVFVRAKLQASAAGVVMAFAGAPLSSALIGLRPLVAGANEVQFSGAAIQSLVMAPSTTVTSISGLDHLATDDPRWQLVELVGLPVDGSWSGVLDLGQNQGPPATLMAPADAALDRFRRGAPFYGWEDVIPAAGLAPVWQPADPEALVKAMMQALPALRTMVTTLPPNRHHEFEDLRALPPVNPVQPGDPVQATLRPLHNLLFGAATDPLASLISGYGTALVDEDLPPITLADRQLFNDPNRSDWDFMVTAHYAKGLDGNSAPVEYAAMVFAPLVDTLPPVPANLAVTQRGLRSPDATDGDWHGIQSVGWDKVPDALPFRVASYAFARKRVTPAGAVEALMGRRLFDTALQPISATTSTAGNQAGRLAALDETYGLASAPATNTLTYALAHQDLFGLWSPWATVSANLSEPAVQSVSLITARLDPTAAGAGLACPTQLVVEFSWDWATRSPQRIELAGRLYAQAKLGDAPALLSVPAGLQASLAGGAGSLVQLNFNGADAPASISVGPGLSATLQFLSLDGQTLQSTPVVSRGPRRYRLTLSGLSLDFNAAGRIGLALWAHGVEQRAPQRVGDWSSAPLVASTADPRPPQLVIEHEDVLMASVADAHGEHHARLTWPAVAGAAGYVVYTCAETKLRADRGMGDPSFSQTLSERLVQLRDAFAANPDRRSFARVNMQPVSGSALQVTLERGTKEIHLYVVLALSAGQVESLWPQPGETGLRKRPIAYAAPQLVRPSPPDLEVTRVLDPAATPPAYRASLRVRTKPGATVIRVDLHRVRVPEAAVELDTMGPPVARITGSSGPWTVQPTVSSAPGAAQALGTISGIDPVDGSWRRVFYRAVSWSGDDPSRGLYGTRSLPSALREVIVPPAGPPDLVALSWHWPGGPLPDAQIDTTTLAPVDTPLGPHRVRADVMVDHPDGTTEVLFQYPAAAGGDDTLGGLPGAPPPAGTHGLWRVDAAAGVSAVHLLARRASVNDVLRVRVLLTDPLGRATERLLSVPAGSPLPPPDILSPHVTAVAAKGFIVDFGTSVPFTPTSAGPYTLAVTIRRKVVRIPVPPIPLPTPVLPRPPVLPAPVVPRPPILPLPPAIPTVPVVPIGPSLPLPPIVQTVSAQVELPAIAVATLGQDLFPLTATIPILRLRGPLGRPLVTVGVRGTAQAEVDLTIIAPDGRRASTTVRAG